MALLFLKLALEKQAGGFRTRMSTVDTGQKVSSWRIQYLKPVLGTYHGIRMKRQ